MTYMEIESLEAKAEVKSDFGNGYQDGMNNEPQKKNSTLQYIEGYKLGFKFKGK